MAADLHRAGHMVAWLCEDRWACILEGSSVISRIHRLPRRTVRQGAWLHRVRAISGLTRELRHEAYDVVIDAQGLAKSAVLAYLAGAGERLGHDRPRAREGSWLVTHRRIASAAVHVIDQQRDLGRLLGITPADDWSFPLPAWLAERQWAAEWLIGQGMERSWMINVGAGWPTKVWPEPRLAECARLARAAGHRVMLLWGSTAEREVAERVAHSAGGVPLAPATTIPQLAGMLSRAAVLISGDTGPLHLARALGTPAIGLFGPVPMERNGPRGLLWRNFQAPGAAWERQDVSRVDMGAIEPAVVVSAATDVART
ncbi:MAG: glycosyltransferase family 9 protein [Planctomycetota bacterium]